MADVLGEYTQKLWQLITRGYTLMQVCSKLGLTELHAPALMALDEDIKTFLIRFIVDWELDLAGLEAYADFEEVKDRVVRRAPRDKKLKNKLTDAFK